MAKGRQYVFTRAARYREVFGGDAGEWVLADILARCGVLTPATAGDAHATVVAAARQAVGLEILGILKKDPGEVWRLMEESNGEENRFTEQTQL